MGQINFAEIFEKLKDDVANLASSTVKNYVNDAKADGLKMLEDMKVKLKRWAQLLADGQLTTSDFEMLVNSQKDLIEMACLKQSGLAAIRVDQFKASLFNLVVDTIFHLIPV